MQELMKTASEFVNITGQMIGDMNEIISGAMGEIKNAVKKVNEVSVENNKNFSDLKAETETFKIDTADEKKKILAVDDDEIHLDITRVMLEGHYEIFTAKSGNEALSLFYRGLVPNLILLDLIMPNMDGRHTYERIKAISSLHDTPIAIFSSSNDSKDKVHAKEIGAIDFIQKPVEKSDLLERVKKLVK
jgi:CheY-like chemotaxis protein